MLLKRTFSFVLLFSVAIPFAACSSDDDDPALTPNPVSDASVKDGSTNPPNDASTQPPKDSGSDAAACQTCGDALQNAITQELCASAQQLINETFACACSPDTCLSECGVECQTGARPAEQCQACLQTKCGDEIAACLADDGSPIPPKPDAGPDSGADLDAAADDASASDASHP